MLSRLLLHHVLQPQHRGKVVRFSVDEPDIHFVTGNTEKRILLFMKAAVCPLTVKEVAVGISSNPSRVTKPLKTLMK